MIIQKTRIILLSAAISASFISGWQVNGWRLGEKMQARETEISKNASQANFEARLLIRQAYEKKINQLEQQAKKAQEEKQKLQSLNKELSEKNDEHAQRIKCYKTLQNVTLPNVTKRYMCVCHVCVCVCVCHVCALPC